MVLPQSTVEQRGRTKHKCAHCHTQKAKQLCCRLVQLWGVLLSVLACGLSAVRSRKIRTFATSIKLTQHIINAECTRASLASACLLAVMDHQLLRQHLLGFIASRTACSPLLVFVTVMRAVRTRGSDRARQGMRQVLSSDSHIESARPHCQEHAYPSQAKHAVLDVRPTAPLGIGGMLASTAAAAAAIQV